MVRNLQYMKMSSFGKNHSRHMNSRGKQVLNKCSTSEVDDVVLIDVDSDVPNVIIVDVEESLQKKLRRPSPRTVINIDDDEVADGVCSNDNDSTSASSSRSSAKPMHSKANGSGNNYGFGSECESRSTESDCSDCECMEGPAEVLRSQWEMASKRRKTNLDTGVFNNNQASTSAPCPDGHSVPGKENATTQPHSSKQSSPTHMRNGEGKNYEENTFSFGNSQYNDGKHDLFDEFAQGCSTMGNNSTKYAEKPYYVDVDSPFSSFCEDECGDQEPFDYFAQSFPAQGPSSPNIPDTTMRMGSSSMGNNSTRYAEKEHGAQEPVMTTNKWDDSLNYPFDEPCLENRQQSCGEQFACDISEPLNEDPSVPKSKLSDDSDLECDRVVFMDVDDLLPTTGLCSSHYYGTTNSNDEANCREPEIVSLQNNQKPETDNRACSSVQIEADDSDCYPLNGLAFDKAKDVLQDVGGKPCEDIIIDRQKIKETDVYKRAMEEELASRQLQLQIQAEEAQRLRKRKKAESKRIMDMERRQKQRLEEMRMSQKKDEEDLYAKEQFRAAIRKELNELEASCRDLATLLRRLGINVGSDSFPSRDEVIAAYKKAVLRFHPDRASRTDMRQIVEAEEKFKLISRMKEKFPLTR